MGRKVSEKQSLSVATDALWRKGDAVKTEVPSLGCCHLSSCAVLPGMPGSAPGALPHSRHSTNPHLVVLNPLTCRNPLLLCSCGQSRLLPSWLSQEANKALWVTRSLSTRWEDCSRTVHSCKKRSLRSLVKKPPAVQGHGKFLTPWAGNSLHNRVFVPPHYSDSFCS